MDMHRKQLGFILIVTGILLSFMVLLVLYQQEGFSSNIIKNTEYSSEMTPSLIFSVILIFIIFLYGIISLFHKFKYYVLSGL